MDINLLNKNSNIYLHLNGSKKENYDQLTDQKKSMYFQSYYIDTQAIPTNKIDELENNINIEGNCGIALHFITYKPNNIEETSHIACIYKCNNTYKY